MLTAYGEEPPEGSVILLHGDTGTAYQRLFSTGMWHPTNGGAAITWAEVWQKGTSVVLIHLAPEED